MRWRHGQLAMLGLIPQVHAQVNRIPEELLTASLIVLAVILLLIALFAERKEIKAAALAYIVIP